MEEEKTNQNAHRWDWLLFWRIDPAELNRQVGQYETLGLTQSMRGISVICLAISVAITVALTSFQAFGLDATSYFDAGLMAVFAVFIYLGHRWAMIAAMIVWTLEKILNITTGFGSMSAGGLVVSQLVLWCVYMHAFYFAFRVEQRKRAKV